MAKWLIGTDKKWKIVNGSKWHLGNVGDPCCCCLAYQQALTKNTLIGTWSGVQFDFGCFSFDGGGSAKLLTAGLDATWAIPKTSQTGGVITFSLFSNAIATINSYPTLRLCNPALGEFLGGGFIQVILKDNGDWSVDVGVGSQHPPSGRLFHAAGGTCLPFTVANQIFGFGFNGLGTVVDVGQSGAASLAFA